MSKYEKLGEYISDWLRDYASNSGISSLVVGISGGIDSALTSTLCAKTGLKTYVVSLPLRQDKRQLSRASDHISWLKSRFQNVESFEFDLSSVFNVYEQLLIQEFNSELSFANSRSRLRMTTLYHIAGSVNGLVVGTGNKVEDFGVGFYTKYGDGGVDVSPIADLMKSEVRELSRSLGISEEILIAKPTDGLWGDDRSDEDQIGASYDELEWAMMYDGLSDNGISEKLTSRQVLVLEIFNRLNLANRHKMLPIPVCVIPEEL
jgi:NAD+ synthase